MQNLSGGFLCKGKAMRQVKDNTSNLFGGREIRDENKKHCYGIEIQEDGRIDG
jgi:hypothetical protein